jgi:hypothetical protein
MLTGHTLRFPSDRPIALPSECVVCGDDPEGASVKLGGRTWSYLGLVPDQRVEVTVPACRACGRFLVVRRTCRWVLLLVTLLGTGIVTFLQLDPSAWSSISRKLIVIGAAFGALIVAAAGCEWLLPLPIDVDPEDQGRTIELEVRDTAYAAKVIALNPHGKVEQ